MRPARGAGCVTAAKMLRGLSAYAQARHISGKHFYLFSLAVIVPVSHAQRDEARRVDVI